MCIRATALVAALAMTALPQGAKPEVVELRQYLIAPNGRPQFTTLFEREFVESQEALGMRLVGQFHDLEDPNRFVWLRMFPDMAQRKAALTAFYSGPVWKAYGGAANALMRDSDNVLLLRPAWPGSGFGAAGPRATADAPPPKAGIVIATICYLWRDPGEDLVGAFRYGLQPQLEAAGLPVVAAFAREPMPNDFPGLPVRQTEKVFVWLTRAESPAAYAAAVKRLEARPGYRAAEARFRPFLERQPQVLRLAPTPRSTLR